MTQRQVVASRSPTRRASRQTHARRGGIFGKRTQLSHLYVFQREDEQPDMDIPHSVGSQYSFKSREMFIREEAEHQERVGAEEGMFMTKPEVI